MKRQVELHFTSDDEEREYWDEHDPSEYFTEPSDVVIALGPDAVCVVRQGGNGGDKPSLRAEHERSPTRAHTIAAEPAGMTGKGGRPADD